MVQQEPAEGRSVKTDQGYMTPYTETIPGANITFQMTPVAGGVVTLGADAAGEEDAEASVAPRVTVELPPYWIGVHEVTWGEYTRFMELNKTFANLLYLRGLAYEEDAGVKKLLEKMPHLRRAVNATPSYVDGVTAPTALYDTSIAYYCGEEPDKPAVSMTVYGAKQYTKWLHLITARDYRLPSEAEWEHAARAGRQGARPTDDQLTKEEWLDANSEYEAHPVGKLAANPWGLHDMLGNVREWVLDAPTGLKPNAANPLSWRAAIATPKQQSPRVAKGGFFESEPGDLSYSRRTLSDDEEWKYSDPNTPMSPWWFADEPAHTVGFRIVRPLKPMDEEDRQLAYEIDSQDLQADVEARVKNGRGKLQTIDGDFPKALEELNSAETQR
ncbi:MAG: formylglycine-generating enzyme family protein, partial [Planctomycetales bacterium]|nr:formylglycine-generating enzyme family protein [Planctomycetales bacterium]